MSNTSKWNMNKALILGAACGGVYTIATLIIEDVGSTAAYQMGRVIGGLIGGAFLFGLVTALRNAFVK